MAATVTTSSTAPRRAAAPARSRTPGVVVRLVLGLAVVSVAWMWWADTPASFGRSPGVTVSAAGQLTGMMGGLLICVQILLVARTPWLEAAVGTDRLVTWHRTLGVAVLLLVLSHVVLAVVGGRLVHRVTLWAELWHGTLVQPQVVRAAVGTLLLLVAGVTSARVLRRRISYEAWYWLHTSSYVATYLAFGHQIRAGAHFAASPVNRWAWAVLYLGTAAVVLLWRVLIPGLSVLRHRVRVDEVVGESAGVTSVWLHGPHLDELAVRGGQFFRFRFLARGHLATAHPYSVSALPEGNRMRITVGALGDHSTAVSDLSPGTLVLMQGPYGRFTSDRARQRKVLLVAGGVGIAPIMTLARDLAAQGRDVVVVHRGSSADAMPLSGELTGDPRLRVLRVLGRRSELGHDPLSARQLNRLVPDLRSREIFLCASPGLSRSVIASARSLGVPQRRIHVAQLSMT